MMVVHDLIHSFKEFIKILVGGVKVSFLLASRSAINPLYSFEVEFCSSSFFSDIQIHSILPSKFFSFNSFNSSGGFALIISSSAIPSCGARVLFLHV